MIPRGCVLGEEKFPGLRSLFGDELVKPKGMEAVRANPKLGKGNWVM